MAYLIGNLIGGTLGMLVVSRLMLWAFRKLGDNGLRLAVAHAASYATAIVIAGLGDGGPNAFSNSAVAYALPALIVVGIDVFRLKMRRAKAATEADPKADTLERAGPDEVAGRSDEEMIEEQQIIRRARDSFDAAQAQRSAEYRAKKNAIAADEAKIRKATEFVEASRLGLALPFVHEETQYWPSWSKLDASRWTPPMALSDLEGPTDSGETKWSQFRAEGGPLYKIAVQRSSTPRDSEMEYATMTLFVDGEEVLGMWVDRNCTKEWDSWHFSVVDALKVGPWIEPFMDLYNRLRSIKESESTDRSNDYTLKKAAKIDLGG